MPEVEIVAVTDLREEEARRVAAEYGIPKVFTDYHEMLKIGEIEAVDVCLHNHFHRPATVAALEAGKHVYCEKPMAARRRRTRGP
jgi:predicted dehydrogenase